MIEASAIAILVTVIFAVGFGVGYLVRAQISARRRRRYGAYAL
jgi:hypothetical protein